MPRFTPDPTKATFGFPVFQKGVYRIELGEPKSFFGVGKGGKPDNYGVRYPAKVIDSDNHEMVGKNFNPITLYQHSEGACNYSKQVEAAILGTRNDEEFNTDYGSEDWSFNTDDGSCGSGWYLLKGQVVDVEVGDPSVNENQDQQTNILKYRTVE